MAKWQVGEQISDNLEEQLLVSRGIKTEEEKRKFFSPDFEKDLHDPFKMLNMDKAVARILSAIEKKEKIAVFGDYDADGVCSAAIFHHFFQKIGFENFNVYLSDRNKEGYGLNLGAVEEFAKKGVNLIITLDCGITDCNEVRMANEKGIDTVIIDHHLESGPLPRACAIVDPKQEKDSYPFEMLAGAGVAFKTVQALVQRGGFNITQGWEKWLLDLVAVATVADMVPLWDENRALAYYGLRVLAKTTRAGFLVFFKKCGIGQSGVSEDDIAFVIAPRLNIASRMEHANISFELLATESPSEVEWALDHLEKLNKERRESVEKILKEIEKRADEKENLVIAEGDSLWHPGLLGLAANKVVEKYGCPVFLWGRGGLENTKGSCRSDGVVNVVEVLKKIPEGILEGFGGHAFAGGFSAKDGKEAEFRRELLKIFSKTGKKKSDIPSNLVDKEIELNDVNQELLAVVEKFRPFGIENPRPVFLFKNLEVINVNKFGNGGIHLRLDFIKGNGRIISAIGFFLSDKKEFAINKDDRIDLVASVERNNFNGYDNLRLRIVDFKKL